MNDRGLSKLGITNCREVFYNPSYDELFQHETDPHRDGFERGIETASGAVAVDTGQFTGRCAKDKYFVVEPTSEDTIWWAGSGSDNRRLSVDAWHHLQERVRAQLSGRDLYVVDAFCGATPSTRIRVRVVTEVAWMAHFAKNMFIRPTDAELENFEPDWILLNACKTTCPDFDQYGMRSEVFIASNIAEKMTLVGGTWYGGEIKKGLFTMMNYFLPLQGVGSFHCSANMGKDGDTALFFGLSGTGKTTLSTDPHRQLIGDDEHGWDDEGIFNFEGGCYAKTINLSAENEPDIYHAIKRDALLENVDLNADGTVDFASTKKTQNTRVSYPITHIDNIVRPISKGGHPRKIVFLTCDAFGVLPPVARLSNEQAMYQYLSGYTAKVAGTEHGVTEPQATFSACFGGPFLMLHPTVYAHILGAKMAKHGATAYLVNTGWTGGPYGVGQRMALPITRSIIDAILDDTIDHCEFTTMPVFNLAIPRSIPNVDADGLLDPRRAWSDRAAYDATVAKLARMFIDNFATYGDHKDGKVLVNAGPTLDN